jgi:hypothetical protein
VLDAASALRAGLALTTTRERMADSL